MPVILRKIRTAVHVMRRCSNGMALLAARYGFRRGVRWVRFRSGLVLDVGDVRGSWGEFTEAAILDAYGLERWTPDVIVDIGANIGAFTCSAAWRFPRASVHAFEPQPEMAAILRHNLQTNRLKNVSVHEQPVTRDGRPVAFYTQPQRGGCGIFPVDGSLARIDMSSTDLSCVDLHGKKCLFLKLDCEGAEGEIIDWVLGAAAALPPEIHVAAEWHPWCPVDSGDTADRLSTAGFSTETRELYGEIYLFASRSGSQHTPP